GGDLQLLCNVETHWSSTLLMIERALLLQRAIDMFFALSDFKELAVYQLHDAEWKSLEIFQDILMIPHTFQQDLSEEKTPTLCDIIPAFKAMEAIWKEHQIESMDTECIVQAGLDKIGCYLE
ncbi:hypothetical protein BDQ17DRAFT_1254661, partial [Cyathus striatus]